jgi:hypothetical protein
MMFMPGGSGTSGPHLDDVYGRAPAQGPASHCRTVQIRAGQHILTAEDPLPPDLREMLALIR